MTFPADLPDNIDTLKAIILASQAKMADQDGIIKRKEDPIIRLEKLLADFKRALYGAKSKKANPDQYDLVLEDIETAMAVVHAEDEATDPPKTAALKKAALVAVPCQNTCRVLKRLLHQTSPVVAELSVTSSGKTSANGWISCPPNSAYL